MITYRKISAVLAITLALSSALGVRAADAELQDISHPFQKPVAGLVRLAGAGATIGGSALTGFGAKKCWDFYNQFSSGDTSISLKTKLGVAAGLTLAAAGTTLTAAGITYVSHYVFKNIGARDLTPEIGNRVQSTTTTLCRGGLGNPEWRIGTVLPHTAAQHLVPDALLLQFPLALPDSSGKFYISYSDHVFTPLGQGIGVRDPRVQDVDTLNARDDVTNINLLGHSCGAADWATLLGQGQLPAKVKLLHLLAPFAHTDDIIDNWIPRLFGITWLNTLARYIAAHKVMPKFGALQPIDAINSAIDNFGPDAPKVIVESSTGDWVVPTSSSQRLAQAMRDKGLIVDEIVHRNWLRGGHDFFFTRASAENRHLVNAWYDQYLSAHAAHPEYEV